MQIDTYDTVIVGAGPGGLFAAHALLRAAPRARLLIVDAGRSLTDRQQLPPTDLGGAGGAGIYLGGRFYLGPATIPVLPPVSAPAGLHPILQGDAYLARARELDTILQSYGVVADLREAPSAQLAAAVEAAQRVGLDYTISYPSPSSPPPTAASPSPSCSTISPKRRRPRLPHHRHDPAATAQPSPSP